MYGDESQELKELDGTDEMYAAEDRGEEREPGVFPDEYLAIESVFLEG